MQGHSRINRRLLRPTFFALELCRYGIAVGVKLLGTVN